MIVLLSIMKKQLLLLVVILLPLVANAHDIEVANADGVTIYYNYTDNGKELEVTSGPKKYTDNVVIPEEVTYMDRTRKVTRIVKEAFRDCSGLTSVIIGNNVTSIGVEAFQDCSNLTFITIGYSVISIGDNAFYGCRGLTSVTIPNSVVTIGDYAFYGCRGLTSITIPNSVTIIGDYAFSICSDLAFVDIPNSVTSIGNCAFSHCNSLTSIDIPNSVTSIGNSAFSGCSGLTSITVPYSVTSIGDGTFSGCTGLTSITFFNSMRSIGARAFAGCTSLTSITFTKNIKHIGFGAFDGADIPIVISLIKKPFSIGGKSSDNKTFTLNTFNNATLYVPVGTIELYKGAEGWKDFVFIEEGTGPNGGGEKPEQCATPTIAYKGGKLSFCCDTEGVTFIYSVTPPSSFQGEGNDVSLPNKYTISVYATKEGYENSETVTKEIELQGQNGSQDVNGDGVVDTQDVLEIYKYIQEH